MLRFLKRDKEEIEIELNQIYHVRMRTQDPNNNLTLCNQKSSHNWIKYNEDNFLREKIFNTNKGKEVRIDGRRCLKCLQLLDKK